MRAIDTNVIVRFLTSDDHAQADRARRLIADGDVFVTSSVLLETEWVLRSGYGFTAAQIVAALRAFAGLPGIRLEDPALAARALDWAERGMDFADALHLAGSASCAAFISFDRKLGEVATGLSEMPVISP